MKSTRILSAAAVALLAVAVASPGVSQTRQKKTIETKKVPVKKVTPKVEVASNADRLSKNKDETYKAQCIDALEEATNTTVTYTAHNCTLKLKKNTSNGGGPWISFDLNETSLDNSSKFQVKCTGKECIKSSRLAVDIKGYGMTSQAGFSYRSAPSKDMGMCMEFLKNQCTN